MLTGQFIRRAFHIALPQLGRNRINPGIGNQLKNLDNEQDLADDPEGIGDLEPDFMQVHKTHRQHEQELQEQRDQVRLKIVKHKYFREEKLPNLLTYAEKEQIRLLHAQDPEEWTLERLAESFPATPAIIKNVIKAKWRARDVKRIQKHDESVIQNWEELKTNKELPPQLREHLLNFAPRRITDLQVLKKEWETLNKQLELPKPKRKDFLSIITSCTKYAERQPPESERTSEGRQVLSIGANGYKQSLSGHPGEDETYLLDKVVDKRKMRLQDLKQLKLSSHEFRDTGPISEAEICDEAPHGKPLPSEAITDFSSVQKYETDEIVVTAEDQKRFEISKVKDHIHIPRKLWRKGATYRVEDCYYDDDGEFLYRVPGMTGKAA